MLVVKGICLLILVMCLSGCLCLFAMWCHVLYVVCRVVVIFCLVVCVLCVVVLLELYLFVCVAFVRCLFAIVAICAICVRVLICMCVFCVSSL